MGLPRAASCYINTNTHPIISHVAPLTDMELGHARDMLAVLKHRGTSVLNHIS